MQHKLFRLVASLALVLALALTQTSVAFASSFTVDSTLDAVDANPGDGVCDIGTGECTLRAAIQEANALAGNDAISLPSGTYYLTIAGNNEDAAATGDLDITSNLDINGTGDVTIDGNGSVINDRVFHITGTFTVNMTGVTIRGGNPGFSEGGGIFVAGGAALTLTKSAVVNNTTSANGGGVRTDSGAILTVTNSTISNNSASSGIGGGIFSAGMLIVTNSTINGNTAIDGGGIYNFPSFTATLNNTIVANSPAGGNCSGTVTDGDGNISWPDTTCPGLNADPLLGSLANNGGPTETHALLPGSPAIDTAADANCPATDQRGVARPQGSACDIGAFELEGGAGTPPTNDNFAIAEAITTLPFSAMVDNSWAGIEPGEPQGDCEYSPKTVWYSFTPVTNVAASADLAGSSISDTILKIYQDTGSGIGGLSYLACAASGSSVNFYFQAGVTYYFQAGSTSSVGGNLQLNLLEIFPPANDNFASATVTGALPFNSTVNNTDATLEPGESQENCYSSKNTVWYSFTPTADGVVKADMAGSSFTDTSIKIYQATGFGINGLGFLTCLNYPNTAVVFSVQAGVTYYIQAGSIYSGGGDLHLNLQEALPPANDDFNNLVTINALPYSDNRDTSTATSAFDDPTSCHNSGSVWYQYTPISDMTITANTIGSDYDTTIGVFTGLPGNLSLVPEGCNDDYYELQSHVSFVATGGTTYYFLLGRCCGSGGNGGGNLVLSIEGIPAPPNNNFANAEAVNSLPFSATADVTSASNEPDEPQWCYSMPNTVWYSFTPTIKTLVRANTQGSAISSNLNVYHDTGSGISGLNLVPSGCTYNYGTVTFIAEAGQTYYFQAGGIYGQVGTIQVNLEQLPFPANDDFANATLVSLPLPFDNTVDTQYSTRQIGEPTPSCAYYGPGSRSVWYAFTPTTSGSFSESIFGYAFTPVFAAYTGSSLGNLTQIGCQTYTGNLMTLQMSAGTTYYFQVGNLYPWEQGGSVQFHLDVTPPPQAGLYYYPGDPSKYDTVQFQDNSYDPGNVGFQTYTWSFGDGTTANGSSATHKYAADGDYQVTHTVTTTDGRTASVTQTVQVRTHDVAITRIAVPNSANAGQTKTITVTLRNAAYPETVQIDLYKSTPNGFVWVATVTRSVPVLSGNRTTAVNFSYTFTSDDAKLGKVTFKAVATLVGARDAYPSDNEAISLITKVPK